MDQWRAKMRDPIEAAEAAADHLDRSADETKPYHRMLGVDTLLRERAVAIRAVCAELRTARETIARMQASHRQETT